MRFTYVLALALLATPVYGQKVIQTEKEFTVKWDKEFPTVCSSDKSTNAPFPICCENGHPHNRSNFICVNEDLYHALIRLWRSQNPGNPGQMPPFPDGFSQRERE